MSFFWGASKEIIHGLQLSWVNPFLRRASTWHLNSMWLVDSRDSVGVNSITGWMPCMEGNSSKSSLSIMSLNSSYRWTKRDGRGEASEDEEKPCTQEAQIDNQSHGPLLLAHGRWPTRELLYMSKRWMTWFKRVWRESCEWSFHHLEVETLKWLSYGHQHHISKGNQEWYDHHHWEGHHTKHGKIIRQKR